MGDAAKGASKKAGTKAVRQTTQNQMQTQAIRGQAPKTVERLDPPDDGSPLPHVHFTDGTSMNIDGTVHKKLQGVPQLTNKEKKWLAENGWPTEVVVTE